MNYSHLYQQNQRVHVFERLSNARAVLHNRVNLNRQLGFALWSNQDDVTSYQKPEHHTLSLYLSGGYQTKRVLGAQSIGGGAPGKLCIMPAGHESHWQVDGPLRFVHLYFSDDDLSRCIEQTWDKSAAQVSLQDLTFIDELAISSLLQHWALKLNWQDGSAQLAFESVSQLLLGYLPKNYVDRRFTDLPSSGGVAPFPLQRCQDFIEQN
ncbi:hypothetical protein ACRRS0_02110 [Agarivorans sp. QJM3NY_29]|uniref:hypothetical protein n=1 Tax=unclassified Agarivorans TaxID=2636026 RepID=UPI003D7C6288